jgi:hypothetical protein
MVIFYPENGPEKDSILRFSLLQKATYEQVTDCPAGNRRPERCLMLHTPHLRRFTFVFPALPAGQSEVALGELKDHLNRIVPDIECVVNGPEGLTVIVGFSREFGRPTPSRIDELLTKAIEEWTASHV